MKAKKLASLLLAAMCTVLASCTDNTVYSSRVRLPYGRYRRWCAGSGMVERVTG